MLNNHAHHRRDYREGPWEAFLQRKARAIQKLMAPGRVLEQLVAQARPVGDEDLQKMMADLAEAEKLLVIPDDEPDEDVEEPPERHQVRQRPAQRSR